MPKFARLLVPPLLVGFLGGVISFAVFLIGAIAYFGLLHEFQTLVSGILAIAASLIVLFGVYARISYDRITEEKRLKRDAFAFATALLRQTEELQWKLGSAYSLYASSAKNGSYRSILRYLSKDLQDIGIPVLFEASWRDVGMLSPDVTLLSHSIKKSVESVRFWMSMSNNRWLKEEDSAIPGWGNVFWVPYDKVAPATPGFGPGLGGMTLSPFHAHDKIENDKQDEDEIRIFLEQQVDHYEKMIKPCLEILINHLEMEAEQYATQLGLDEKTKWLRTQAKARRDARGRSAARLSPAT